MFNRAEVVEQNFTKYVREGRFPQARSATRPTDVGLGPVQILDLFETQLMSRHLDLHSRVLKNLNKTYYTIGSSGHEGNAAVGKVFRTTDMAFLHYRSGALMIQRMKQKPGSTPLYDMWLSFFASREEPISGGRHKVFGSRELFVPPQTSTIASHLPKAVGAALSVTRAKDLHLATAELPMDAVILCSFGDASANHSTAQGAFNTASLIAHQNIGLPLVFLCEDNGIGISVPTAQDWIRLSFESRPHFQYILCDGLNLCDVYGAARAAEEFARRGKKPVFLHMKTVRLMGHAGSDMETNYMTLEQIEAVEFDDPLLHSARACIEWGLASADEILALNDSVKNRVLAVAASAELRESLSDPSEVASTITACAVERVSPPLANDSSAESGAATPVHLAKHLNMVLSETLTRYPQALVFGEDVARKGGVYNVTDGLWKKFGARRVFNSPLDEQAILGTAIGMAHNGFLPIPEIQFLAYVHNAEDQIRGEAATLAFFSKGQFVNPMVVRVAGLAYQKGFGGHFHNDNSLAVFRDIPGLIVAVPSRGDDAVKMFRTCTRSAWEKGRVVIFIEPIALYMTRDLHEPGDKQWTFDYPGTGEIGLGEFGYYDGSATTVLLTYGNGTYLSLQAKKILRDKHHMDPAVIDLRWIAPLNREALIEKIRTFNQVVIVEECRKTGSLSEGLVALITEHIAKPPRLHVVAAQDCFIPLGRAAIAGLPKVEDIVGAALALANGTAVKPSPGLQL
jgi:2-oxoisovalerate dehydrogenase E1 component